ncbi:hypothetical protein [Pseudaestuariivita rosea]|uniref:hypothetical protein n=1 Tax=Pseudaestuariivita rosea TaxID=2763263 RepID=UPI001ABB2713|nr:hypothetical protein [Pseudaestuariivita rosea]
MPYGFTQQKSISGNDNLKTLEGLHDFQEKFVIGWLIKQPIEYLKRSTWMIWGDLMNCADISVRFAANSLANSMRLMPLIKRFKSNLGITESKTFSFGLPKVDYQGADTTAKQSASKPAKKDQLNKLENTVGYDDGYSYFQTKYQSKVDLGFAKPVTLDATIYNKYPLKDGKESSKSYISAQYETDKISLSDSSSNLYMVLYFIGSSGVEIKDGESAPYNLLKTKTKLNMAKDIALTGELATDAGVSLGFTIDNLAMDRLNLKGGANGDLNKGFSDIYFGGDFKITKDFAIGAGTNVAFPGGPKLKKLYLTISYKFW